MATDVAANAAFALEAAVWSRRVRFVMFSPDTRQHRRCQAGNPPIELSEFPEPPPFTTALALRTDFDAAALLVAVRRSKDAAQARRLLALAAVYDGATRSEAARLGGVTLQIVRAWVMRFNALGAAGQIDRKAPGFACALMLIKSVYTARHISM